jgi:hypothetical protein
LLGDQGVPCQLRPESSLHPDPRLGRVAHGRCSGYRRKHHPEADGIFLSTEDWDVDYFVRMNNTGGPVDVWQIDGVDADQMLDNGNGYPYLPGRIPADRITWVETPAVRNISPRAPAFLAFQQWLTSIAAPPYA